MFISKVVNTASRAAKMAQIARAARLTTRGSHEDRALAQRALVNLLADARGVPMKIGQFLATVPGGESIPRIGRIHSPPIVVRDVTGPARGSGKARGGGLFID